MTFLNVSSSLIARAHAVLIDPSVLRLFVSEVMTGQYCNVALATVLAYHSGMPLYQFTCGNRYLTVLYECIVITLDQEVRYTLMACLSLITQFSSR